MRYDVVVVGAGAAGMMCAAQAGRRGRRVLLIEHAAKVGERIRISGGGRCNFTNVGAGAANYLSRNPDFCRSALARYTARDFIEWVEARGIAYHEKTLGQLFCDGPSRQVIDLLLDAVDDAGVQWAHPCSVQRVVALDAVDDRFALETDRGTFRCASLVVATGGLAVPKLGATPFGYRLAEQFGLRVVPPKPALVPLALPPQTLCDACADLRRLLRCGSAPRQCAVSRKGAGDASRTVRAGDPANLELLANAQRFACIEGRSRCDHRPLSR